VLSETDWSHRDKFRQLPADRLASAPRYFLRIRPNWRRHSCQGQTAFNIRSTNRHGPQHQVRQGEDWEPPLSALPSICGIPLDTPSSRILEAYARRRTAGSFPISTASSWSLAKAATAAASSMAFCRVPRFSPQISCHPVLSRKPAKSRIAASLTMGALRRRHRIRLFCIRGVIRRVAANSNDPFPAESSDILHIGRILGTEQTGSGDRGDFAAQPDKGGRQRS